MNRVDLDHEYVFSLVLVIGVVFVLPGVFLYWGFTTPPPTPINELREVCPIAEQHSYDYYGCDKLDVVDTRNELCRDLEAHDLADTVLYRMECE